MAQENWQKYKLLKLLELLLQESDEQHSLTASTICGKLAEVLQPYNGRVYEITFVRHLGKDTLIAVH